jgi:hypothetical protein
MTAGADRAKAAALNGAAVRDAWSSYLVACRTTHPATYPDVEAWAPSGEWSSRESYT